MADGEGSVMGGLVRAWHHFRSIVSIELMGWALNAAPKREKYSLAKAFGEHMERIKNL